jgi:hypothetical protein
VQLCDQDCKTCSMLLRVLEQPRVDNSSVEFLKQEPNWLKTGPDIHVLMTWSLNAGLSKFSVMLRDTDNGTGYKVHLVAKMISKLPTP